MPRGLRERFDDEKRSSGPGATGHRHRMHNDSPLRPRRETSPRNPGVWRSSAGSLARGAIAALLLASPAAAQSQSAPGDDFLGLSAIPVLQVAIPAEAWWTGPVSASSAETLPRGRFLLEPYLFDVRKADADHLGSLTYLLYGLTDRTTVGAIPTFGSTGIRGSGRKRRFAANDLTLTLQHRLNRAREGALVPTVSLVVQQSLAIGRFDRLDGDVGRGIGIGTPTTLVGLYAQRVDRMAGGRPLRTRLNLTHSLPWPTTVRDDSVYGTPAGYRGTVRPGRTTLLDLSVEYSLSRSWVLAADLVLRRTAAGRLDGTTGIMGGDRLRSRLPAAEGVSVAPAVEYSWSSTRGVLLGVRLSPRSGASTAAVTPVMAFNAIF